MSVFQLLNFFWKYLLLIPSDNLLLFHINRDTVSFNNIWTFLSKSAGTYSFLLAMLQLSSFLSNLSLLTSYLTSPMSQPSSPKHYFSFISSLISGSFPSISTAIEPPENQISTKMITPWCMISWIHLWCHRIPWCNLWVFSELLYSVGYKYLNLLCVFLI